MNITSMTGRELFNTLFGRDTTRQITAEAKEEFYETVKPDENGKYDRLMVATVDNTENIDPDTSSVTALYESGMGGILKLQRFQAPISDKDFVERFGEMGKRLDEAYKEGKFTEDEYNELNKGLAELATKTKALSNERAASIEYAREQLRFQFENPDFVKEEANKKKLLSKEEQSARAAELKEERLSAIQKILNRPGFATPIEKLLEMINDYRQKA
ncbi:MAG: hypothetical protein LBM41_05550 [Ruminococcus sp.]|jgi:hypothetical protein|nr:hypothetical protein [Ruminococcus sp.]